MSLLFAILTNFLSQFLKEFVAKRWGSTGVIATIFLISLTISTGWYFIKGSESLLAVFKESLVILSFAITIYEVILKRLSISGEPLLKSTTTILRNEE